MRVVSQDARLKRAAGRVEEAVVEGADIDSLMDACADAIDSLADWDAVFLSAADPGSGQFTATRCVRELPVQMCAPWIRNEFLEPDVNKFSRLRGRGVTVSTLGEATQGQVELSRRYRELYRPSGFGHELRAVLRDRTGCWGYLTLVREAGAPDFTEDEQRLVESIAPMVASAVRRSHGGVPESIDLAPGVVVVDRDGEVRQVSDSAQRAFDQVCAASILAVGAAAFAAAEGAATPPPFTRVRAGGEAWLSVRGDVMRGESGEAETSVVIIEPATPAELLPVLTTVYAFTPRERDVIRRLARGESNAQIAAQLEVSRHTVRDHVSSIFQKTGCSSRGELVHLLFGTDATGAL